MSPDDIGQALFYVAWLALIAVAILKRGRREPPGRATTPTTRDSAGPETSTAYVAFLWLLIVVALVLAAILYSQRA